MPTGSIADVIVDCGAGRAGALAAAGAGEGELDATGARTGAGVAAGRRSAGSALLASRLSLSGFGVAGAGDVAAIGAGFTARRGAGLLCNGEERAPPPAGRGGGVTTGSSQSEVRKTSRTVSSGGKRTS